MLWILVILASSIVGGNAKGCISRSFGKDSIVCVCNATHCDFTPGKGPPEKMTFHWYMSDKLGHRMHYTKGHMFRVRVNGSIISINRTSKYQTILGFGAAFTDAAGINIKNISLPVQEKLIQSYFGDTGSRYSFGRVPIGGTDFSNRRYSLDDVNEDKILQHFALSPEDLLYKIPLLQKAALLNPDLKLIGVPWSAPKWMKIKESFSGFGVLKQEYYQLFSDYIIKFFDEYKKFGLGFWGLSVGNEPQNAISPVSHVTTMAWTPYGAAKWIRKNLGPSLNASEYKKTQILILDDTIDYIPWYVNTVMDHKEAKKYVSGTAIHYHRTVLKKPNVLDEIHKNYPDKYIIMTEASQYSNDKICLGCWDITEAYILQMFQNMEHWVVGWMDLNLALNKDGAPNLSKNKYDAAIIVDAEHDEFFKQPLFYVMQHFSRFIPPGSVRIHTRINMEPMYDAIQILAFETPKNETVLVIYNKNGLSYKVGIVDGDEGFINIDVSEFSLNTIIFKR